MRIKKDRSALNDETLSCNKSTTTTGGGLASKIGVAMSRILTANPNNVDDNDEEVADLIELIDELNSNADLAVKLSS